MGAGLVLGETYRSSRLEGLEEDIKRIRGLLEGGAAWEKGLGDIKEQYVLHFIHHCDNSFSSITLLHANQTGRELTVLGMPT